jgi:hypothetical protein
VAAKYAKKRMGAQIRTQLPNKLAALRRVPLSEDLDEPDEPVWLENAVKSTTRGCKAYKIGSVQVYCDVCQQLHRQIR